MSQPRLQRWTAAFLLAGPLLGAGCDARHGTSAGGTPTAAPPHDGEAQALALLENHPDLAKCRTALQQLDAQDGAGSRPTFSDAERAELTARFNLTPAEVAELGQSTFSQVDAAYLQECLLVRAGVRTLKIDSRPPLDRARIAFEWTCRLVYLDDRTPWPANPWTTLEGGSGIALSRAYVVLAVWQQLGLDGCLVGPPALKTTASYTVTPTLLDIRSSYGPVRACGVQVGSDVFLFDPAAGRPLAGPDAGGILTLAQARKNPAPAKGFDADEVKSWRPYLAPPLPGLSRRMEWLEKRNPGGSGVKLYVDLAARGERAGADTSEVWNPPGDTYSAPRILGRFESEEATGRVNLALRDQHRLAMTPLDQLPKTNLSGRALNELTGSFLSQFGSLRYAPNTPRDLLLRGQYSEAMSALADAKQTVDNARSRIEQDPTLQKDFERWTEQLQVLTARTLRPEPGDPTGAQAQRALEQFRNDRRSRDIEKAFVLGHAARPLGAEVAFLTAECVHERAERAQAEKSERAKGLWRNAAEWWQRFLDASVQANSPFPAREPHARNLLARCQQFTGKSQ
jgi:hypothetical protein